MVETRLRCEERGVSRQPQDRIATELGTRIRQAREREGLTQAALAEKLGVSQGAVTFWEAGQPPSPANRKRLDEVLGTGLGSEGGEDAPPVEDVVSSFGAWLRDERLKSGLSVPELSERSGVSAPAIYNIESGKSQNPQAKTRNLLAIGVNAKVPNQVVVDTVAQQSVVGLGPLVDFQPHDRGDWPACAGVYVFYDVSQRPVYVGKASNIAQRLKSHEDRFWFKRPIVEYASFIAVPDDDLRHQLEQSLIKFLKSNAVINRQSAEAFDGD